MTGRDDDPDIRADRPWRARGEGVRLLTAADLAARWQVPQSQVYHLTRRRALPVVRLGRYYRYRLDLIEEWERAGGASDVERRTTSPRGEAAGNRKRARPAAS